MGTQCLPWECEKENKKSVFKPACPVLYFNFQECTKVLTWRYLKYPFQRLWVPRQPDCCLLAWYPFFSFFFFFLNLWSDEEEEGFTLDQGNSSSQADNYQRGPSNAFQCAAHNPLASKSPDPFPKEMGFRNLHFEKIFANSDAN